jgi:hypothetical protein
LDYPVRRLELEVPTHSPERFLYPRTMKGLEISEKVFMNSLEDWVGGVRKPSSGHI